MHAPAASPAIIEHVLLFLGEQPPSGPPLSATDAPETPVPLELTTLTISEPPWGGVTRPWISTGPPA